MAMVVQLLVLLCLFFSSSGSSDVFRAVGDSVQLEIQNSGVEIKTLSWIFNGSKNVLDYVKKFNDIDPSPDYKDRVEFNNKTYSLTLKNLQKTDSGLYLARASGVTVAEYRLSVIGTESLKVHSGLYWLMILPAVGILGVLVVGYRWIKQRRSPDSEQSETTLYTDVKINDQPSSRKAKLEKDSIVYSTVKHPASSE